MKRITRKTAIGLMMASAALMATVEVASARGFGGHGGPGGPGGPGGFAQMDFADIDADGSGTITLEELQALGDARFAALDTDASGALDKAEITQMLTEGAEKRAANRAANGRTMPEGRDGATPSAERLAWMADGMFLRMDADKDGLISAAEMQQPTERLERLIDRFDTDDDNAISEAEFDAAKDKQRGRGQGRGRG